MSNLDNIINEILQDADKEAKFLIDEAKKEVECLVGERKAEARKEADKIVGKAKVEAVQLKDRMVSSSNLTSRDMVLVAKQEMIDKVFELAKEKLMNLDSEKYLKFIENSLKNLEIKENTEILLTAKEKEKAGDKLFGIKVSDDVVESGFSLKTGKIILNNEFSSIVDLAKEDLEQEVAEKLFS